jgi:hypothetical protein
MMGFAPLNPSYSTAVEWIECNETNRAYEPTQIHPALCPESEADRVIARRDATKQSKTTPLARGRIVSLRSQ